MKRKSRIIKLTKYEPIDLTDQKVRLELNEAKWIGIWSPSHSRAKTKLERRIERRINETDIQAITVHYVHGVGTLTTFDLKIYLALILIWEKNGRPTNKPVPFSLAQLARIMSISWNARTAAKLRRSLNRLAVVPMKWENAFYHKASDQILTVIAAKHILSYLVFGKRKQKGKKVTEKDKGAFKFDQHVLDNLMANYSKPVHIDDALSLKNEIAILLLMHLDIVMADKSFYSRNSAELFQEFGLQDQIKYQYPSGRKQALEPAIKELKGKRLSTGVIAKISLVSNLKGNDLKLTVHKGKLNVIDVEATPITQPELTFEQKTTNKPSTIEPKEPLTEEQNLLIERLQKDFSVKVVKATNLVLQQLEATKLQLAAWSYRDQSQIQDKAGWIIKAIEQEYELPQAYLDAVKEQEQREKARRTKVAIAECKLCDESGTRFIRHNGQQYVKRCTHDKTIEAQYKNAFETTSEGED